MHLHLAPCLLANSCVCACQQLPHVSACRPVSCCARSLTRFLLIVTHVLLVSPRKGGLCCGNDDAPTDKSVCLPTLATALHTFLTPSCVFAAAERKVRAKPGASAASAGSTSRVRRTPSTNDETTSRSAATKRKPKGTRRFAASPSTSPFHRDLSIAGRVVASRYAAASKPIRSARPSSARTPASSHAKTTATTQHRGTGSSRPGARAASRGRASSGAASRGRAAVAVVRHHQPVAASPPRRSPARSMPRSTPPATVKELAADFGVLHAPAIATTTAPPRQLSHPAALGAPAPAAPAEPPSVASRPGSSDAPAAPPHVPPSGSVAKAEGRIAPGGRRPARVANAGAASGDASTPVAALPLEQLAALRFVSDAVLATWQLANAKQAVAFRVQQQEAEVRCACFAVVVPRLNPRR